jgi:SAM-dependent methyltransferase
MIYPVLDNIYLKIDRSDILRTKNIRNIPGFKERRGGKRSYAEWAHVVGIFQTLIFQNINNKTGNVILDIGCGTGLLGIASQPFVGEGGKYIGIDVMENEIDFCKSHFTSKEFEFIHFDVHNAAYADKQADKNKMWPFENGSVDLVTALSVWTHLKEEDAVFYFTEIARVLKKGSKAIITFFYLDESYEASLQHRINDFGRYHFTNQQNWIFDESAYGSKNWCYPGWLNTPEEAIGVKEKGLEILLERCGLKMIQYYPGNWKEQPGIFFQDVLVFEK